ncbi:hypothetical protein [Lentzea tibetensis]|uniref:hypothetical protein n=1 Tax=Lentzea tibetensis TaxID=2591470 RepID=UPI0016462D13|nr:hypothetical protein [Lentzea tibetensis]
MLAAALPWPVGILVLMFAALGAPDDPGAAGRLVGFMMFPWLGAAFFTWLIFRRKRVNFFVLLAVTLPFFFLLFGFAAAGRLNG